MKTKKYKLIKEYPGSPKLGTVVFYKQITIEPNYGNYWGFCITSINTEIVERNPEYWEEIKEKPATQTIEDTPDYTVDLQVIDGRKQICLKRTSDGKYFYIGIKTNKGVIKGINFKEDYTFINLNGNSVDASVITSLTIVNYPCVFSDDGNTPLYPGDECYIVYLSSMTCVKTTLVIGAKIDKNLYKVYKSKINAENYITLNKQ